MARLDGEHRAHLPPKVGAHQGRRLHPGQRRHPGLDLGGIKSGQGVRSPTKQPDPPLVIEPAEVPGIEPPPVPGEGGADDARAADLDATRRRS